MKVVKLLGIAGALSSVNRNWGLTRTMNIECGCFGRCDMVLQIGDADKKCIEGVIPIRMYGRHEGESPTVWLNEKKIDALIEALQEAKAQV